MQEIGKSFCEAVVDYCDPDQTKVRKVIKALETLYPNDEEEEDEEDGSNESDHNKGKNGTNRPPRDRNGNDKLKKYGEVKIPEKKTNGKRDLSSGGEKRKSG